jgi:hypothetical protein
MRCARARRMLYLFRDGELSEHEKKILANHLERCAACASEARRIPELNGLLSSLRSVQPDVEYPEGLTLSILRSVDEVSRPTAVPKDAWVVIRRLRPLLAGSTILLVGAFFLQTYSDAKRISELEGRLGQQDKLYAAQERGLMQSVVDLALSLSGGERRISRFEASTIMSAMLPALTSEGGTARGTIVEILKRKYPHLASLSPGTELTPREREVVVEETREFLKEVDHLIEQGGGSHVR